MISVNFSLILAGNASSLSESGTTLGEVSATSPSEVKAKDTKGAEKEPDTAKGEGAKEEVENAAFQGVDLNATYPRQEPVELPGWHQHSETLPLMASEESINQLEFWENKPVLHSGHKLGFDKKDN